MRQEAALFESFFSNKLWKRVNTPLESDFTFFPNETKAFEASRVTLVNRIPGIGFLALKREHFYILNRYRKSYFDKPKYFPHTFLVPEDFSSYEEYHN
jgi:hypothetical protein